jgi:hypothetical protein
MTQAEARRRTYIWVLIVLLIMPVAGLIGWRLNQREDPPAVVVNSPPPEPPRKTPRPVPAQTKVTLTSTPPGAQVRLGDDILGRTPVERDVAQLPRGVQASFVFRLTGHDDVTINTSLRESEVRVHADFTRPPTKAETPEEVETKVRRPFSGRPIKRFIPKTRPTTASTIRQGQVESTTGDRDGVEDQENDTPTSPPRQSGTSPEESPAKEPSRPRVILDNEPRNTIPIID